MTDIVTNGDIRVDGVFAGNPYRWNASSALGTPVTLTYSIPSFQLAYSKSDPENGAGWRPFTAAEQAEIKKALAYISSFTGITFQQVAATDQSYGQIVFNANLQADSSGYAYYPNDTSGVAALAGDVYIDTETMKEFGFSPGTEGYATLLHEIGHALGEKHLGAYDGDQVGAETNTGPYLNPIYDSTRYSIMSYTAPEQGQVNTTYSIYDILALRTVYGKRDLATGNDTYAYGDDAGLLMQTIIDDGGTDTLDVSALTRAAVLNLTPGSFSSIGTALSGGAAEQNFAVALDALIENVIGTAFADRITGNTAANRITAGGGGDIISGGAGADVIDGGAGLDYAVYTGARAGYTLTLANGLVTAVADQTAARDGSDQLSGIERLQFSDMVLAFDVDGTAGQTYRLYRAAFARTPDQAGLSHNVKLEDGGLSLKNMSAAFIGSAEFTKLYGANVADAAYISALYHNVLGRDPDAAGSAGWLQRLADKSWDRADVLIGFSESAENKAAVASIIANGIALDLGLVA